MKSLIFGTFVVVICSGCAVGVQPAYVGTCEHWATCESSPTNPVSADQCETGERKSYYDSLAAGCETPADALEECLTNMPCDGFVDTASEQKYCGEQMQALASCH